MTRARGTSIVALTTHARSVPADARVRFAAALADSGTALVVESCHRVEAYLATEDEAARLVAALPVGGRTLTGADAVRHAMGVAVGRDSVVLGEDQILHQLRTSVEAARASGTLDPRVERLFAIALRAGRRARSWRQGPQPSLADVAVEAIERRAGSLRGRQLLVVGAGRMGRLATRAAIVAGASVAVANRSTDRAAALAASAGARVEAFEADERVAAVAGVIVALGGPWPIREAGIEALRGGSAIVVDLSVPVAVPPALIERLGDRFISADALALADLPAAVAGNAVDPGTAARHDALIDESTSEFLAWQDRRRGRAAAAALVERADEERAAELAALWRRLPDLEPDAREAIETMTRHLAGRLLREPLERLGRDADGRDERVVRDLFAL